MQSVKRFAKTLVDLRFDGALFLTLADLRAVLLGLSPIVFRSVITWSEKSGLLKRVFRGLYLYPPGGDGGGLILQAESREEILADKIVALALRPNKLKNRELWDIGWLKQ